MFLNIAMATKSTLYTIAEKQFDRGIFVYLKKKLCPLKMIKTMDAQNTKEMRQYYHKRSWYDSFLPNFFRDTNACILL